MLISHVVFDNKFKIKRKAKHEYIVSEKGIIFWKPLGEFKTLKGSIKFIEKLKEQRWRQQNVSDVGTAVRSEVVDLPSSTLN